MKKTLSCIFLLFFYVSLFAQKENINCIIMIDGKLASNDLQGYIEYNDNTHNIRKIELNCHTPGIIGINIEDMTTLRNLPAATEVEIHFDFTEFQKGVKQTYHYSHPFIISDLLNRGFIVFSITNLDKKKKIYYFDYAIDNMRKAWRKEWKKGYRKKHQIFYNEYRG